MKACSHLIVSLWLIFAFTLTLPGFASEPATAAQNSGKTVNKIVPKQWHRAPAAYEISGGLWRVDHSFEARLQIKNHIQLASITVTPVLFMADGTEYALPSVELEPAGVTSLSINMALQNAPPAIAKHLSEFGSVSLRYNWAWPGALDASVQSLDAPRSLIFVSSLAGGMHQEPWRKHAQHKERQQIFEGLWWKHDPDVGGFIALSNTSQNELSVTLRASAAKRSDGLSQRSISICAHCTQMLDLGELLLDLPQGVIQGGVRVSYKGMPNSLAVTAGLENANEGFSAGIRFKVIHDPASTSPAKVSPQMFAGVGIMVGDPDPMMMFPTGTRFTPYAVLHNTSPGTLTVTPSVNYMDASGPRTLPLPAVNLDPLESRQLDLPSILAAQGMAKFNGAINLSFAYSGAVNDLLAALGSVDQKGTYVFEVEARRVAPGAATSVNYWNLNDGNDTMITLWNPAAQDEDLLVTLYFMGGHYKIPIHLAAGASTDFNISEVIMARHTDPDGNHIPSFIRQGSAVVSSAQDETGQINVVVEAGTFNAKTKTCAGNCQTCYGYSDYWDAPDPLSLAVGASSPMSATAQWETGAQYDVTTSSSWSSSSGVATVTNGLVQGVSAGSGFIIASFTDAVPGTACSGLDDLDGDPTMCPLEDTMETESPVTVAPDHLVVTSDVTSVLCTTNNTLRRIISYSEVDVNGNSVGNISTEEQFGSKGTNSCNTSLRTSETCSPDAGGVLQDAITVGCNSVGGSCGATYTKQQWLYCPSSGTPIVFATPGDIVVHNNSITVGGSASFPAGTKISKSGIIP